MEKYETYDDLIQRYCAAFDELEYIAHQFARKMAVTDEYEIAEDYLKAMMEKSETLLEEIELIHGDACTLEHSEGDNE